jgi:formate hydrogenlyase subunit 6/NADH:ubiquinone oxidoreductase subunit I
MDALQIKYSAQAKNKYAKAPMVDEAACLGCGVCAHKCPTKSLALEPREETKEPPENAREYMQKYMADRRAAKQREDLNPNSRTDERGQRL